MVAAHKVWVHLVEPQVNQAEPGHGSGIPDTCLVICFHQGRIAVSYYCYSRG